MGTLTNPQLHTVTFYLCDKTWATIVNMDVNSHAYVSGYYRSQQIQIGSQIYTSSNINKSDLFFAIYEQPFKAVITDEDMVSCNGLSDGMLTVTPYFGRPPFTYKRLSINGGNCAGSFKNHRQGKV